MTREMQWMGFFATLLIMVVLGTVALREPVRQVEAAQRLQAEAIVSGMDIYAEHCVICHGAAGEGLGAYPVLDSAGVQGMDTLDLVRVVERGRYNTAMAAYGVTEGGILSGAHINALATLIQHGDWNQVAARVEALGLTPPVLEIAEVSEEMLQTVGLLENGESLTAGLTLYAENCAACHGANGEGTTLAPAVNSTELRARMDDAALVRVIEQGVPGTLMAAWNAALTDTETADLVSLIRRWEEIEAAGIEMPVVEAPAIDMSPETLATGEWLYGLLCAQCHGANGFGSPLAPALNNQLYLAETPDAAIQQIIAMGVQGTSMPAWGGRLTDADLAALTAYIRSWEPDAPAIVTVP
ncbi:MAG: c-type cytochrome [Anaerolineae bacterium]|nr:c-type cytochrome [Anaerolineae bacterium]